MNILPYSEVDPTLKTGDIVLFGGKYDISKEIEWFEKSRWSHVGMVVRIPGIEAPVLWESTDLDNLEDVEFHDRISGPKLVYLHDRIANYNGSAYAVRHLEVERTPQMTDPLFEFVFEAHGLPDPGAWKMLIEFLEGRILKKCAKLDNYFCSELVAETYIKMGLLSNEIPPNAYMPKDFSSDGKINLVKGTLSEEIFIEIESPPKVVSSTCCKY